MFAGSIVALVTPFCAGKIDYVALKKLVEFHISSGTDAILVCGSTGEGLLLSDAEREHVIAKTIEISNKRMPIIVGCSSCWTDDAIKLTSQAEKLGADGVLLIAPYYVKPTQNGIIEHFKTVHNSTNIPIIAYNNPGRCAVGMTIDTVAEIAKLPRVVGLKDSNTNLARVNFLKYQAPKLKLFSGDDPTLPGYLAHGGDGCISVTANIVPRLVKQLLTSWQNRDIDNMQKTANMLAPVSEAMFVEPNPIPVKYALSRMKLIDNELRLPLTMASDKTKRSLDLLLSSIQH
ncbi:MAG: 4-hydroxy-tetrahydrodipicolinate synthase [Alphaproteobacteria bacterium]|nr:4-hydroxy-tetrahydrodipicolinate synthase [Alphaproteobacteria bacterium]